MMQPDKKKTIKTKSGGTTEVRSKTVKDAKANKGIFKERPAYKGGEVKGKSGKMYGYKKNDGSYTATPTFSSKKQGKKALAKDRAMHKADSTSHSRMIKTFQNPIAKKK